MQAIMIEQYGGPEVLQRRELAVPEPGDEEVLVRVAFAGVNFMDVHTRQGKYKTSSTYPVRLPTTLGMEGAGVVVKAGSRVTNVVVGDRVAWCISWGAYAEYARVPARLAARVPAGIALDTAAAAMFQGCTAHYLLNDVAQLKAGDSCLIHAASGSIGQILIQLCKRLGVRIFATASTPAKCEVARRLGADHPMPYDEGSFAQNIRALTDGRGVDVVYDCVGGERAEQALRAIAWEGRFLVIGFAAGIPSIPLNLALLKGCQIVGVFYGAMTARDPALGASIAEELLGLVAAGDLRPHVSGRYPLERASEALRLLIDRQAVGKVVVTP